MEPVSSSSCLLSVGSYESNPYPQIVFENIPTKDGSYGHEGHRRLISTRAIAVSALVLSCLGLVALLAGAAMFEYQLYPSGEQGYQSDEVCLPCIQVNPDPLQAVGSSPLLDKLDRRYMEENDTEICCARTTDQYATLFKLILKRQEAVKQLADILGPGSSEYDNVNQADTTRNRTTVSAHLVIKPMLAGNTESHTVQEWKSPLESPISHVTPGLRYHDNQIVVQRPGLYFIYCQILYIQGDSEVTAEPQVVSNYVKRTSVLYPATSGILLKSRHTRYSPEQDRHSSYVGGLFFLHEGDVLFVQVALPQLVSHDDTASFFGLFRVGD